MGSNRNVSNYQSTLFRDPIWTRVSEDPQTMDSSSSTLDSRRSESKESVRLINPASTHGLNILSTSIFIAGEMAGSGVLALPRAIVDAGWIGIAVLLFCCVNAGYGGTRIGKCWAILEERYPELRIPVRNPYAMIAQHAVGNWGRLLVSGCMQFTLFGAGIVYLLLASQLIRELLRNLAPGIGLCHWFIIIAVVLCPAMWLGSPKHFCAVAVGALLTTALSCLLIFTQIVIDGLHAELPPPRRIHGFSNFFLSFGTILFAFGGASTFPTIQNDMTNKKKFPTAVIIGFIAILSLYIPVAVGGYLVYGEEVNANIILSLQHTSLVTLANLLMAIHLILAFLIVVNPVCQELEEIWSLPTYFHWKRCVLRSTVVIAMIFVGETIPQFGKILSLVGGSTIALLTFVLPPIFYMRICDQKKLDWPERLIPFHTRVYLWELVVIGLLGGTAATYNAILEIFTPNALSKPCYWWGE